MLTPSTNHKPDNKFDLKVVGVYKNAPSNSFTSDIEYVMPWKFRLQTNDWLNHLDNPWGMNGTVYGELAPNVSMEQASRKIKDAKYSKVNRMKEDKPELWLHPMNQWHLYSDEKRRGNRRKNTICMAVFIDWHFCSLIGLHQFHEPTRLSSEKRARSRYSQGCRFSSPATHLTVFCESILIAAIAAIIAIVLVQISLPAFNDLADKKITIPIYSPFTETRSLICGNHRTDRSYPALYLSSFNPVKVLKGIFKAGRMATVQRKVLVVAQFAVSVILIIGTIVVFRQIQYAKNRPSGYDQNG